MTSKYTINLLIAEDGPVWEAPVIARFEASGRTVSQLKVILREARKSLEASIPTEAHIDE